MIKICFLGRIRLQNIKKNDNIYMHVYVVINDEN